MKAVAYDGFGQPPDVRELPEPSPSPDGVVIAVAATGLCRSDWHGWMGHDADIERFPHVPGHEFAGTIAAVGANVTRWRVGDKVTAPFVCGCGTCEQCAAGDQQICARQTQPGFTHWGSFADYVAIEHADVNVVAVPPGLGYDSAAALGCRFGTAFRAVHQRANIGVGEWVAVYGCGGLGLSAVLIAVARGARVIAVDRSAGALEMATELGAEAVVSTATGDDPVPAVRELTGGGAHAGLECAGNADLAVASIHGLRRGGCHVQVGLLPPRLGVPSIPMDRVIAHELRLFGSHGIAAGEYPALLRLVESGQLQPQRLVRRHVRFADVPRALSDMDAVDVAGITLWIRAADAFTAG